MAKKEKNEDKANKAIKYRIYPTEEQKIFFAKNFGCCRKIYNLMLEDKIVSYKETGSFGKQTPARYKKEHPYLKEVDSLGLANVQLNLEKAIKNYCEDKKKYGFPKFKSAKRSRRSYTTSCQYPKPSNSLKQPSIRLYERGIHLPKIGKVRAKVHRLPKEEWMLKSVTVSEERDGTYYASVLFEYGKKPISHAIEKENCIGMDYKSNGLYMDSSGNWADMPKYYRSNQKKLAKEQRKLSRKIGARKGETPSNNYKKQQKKVAKIHRHIANMRNDSLQKKSTEIANQYDIVCVEDLNMRAMANKGFGNGKATLDNGYGKFLAMLEYKMEERGKYLIKVDKWYPSSQICTKCGRRKKLKLEERTYECVCGLVLDRDVNAAINIKREGLRLFEAMMK